MIWICARERTAGSIFPRLRLVVRKMIPLKYSACRRKASRSCLSVLLSDWLWNKKSGSVAHFIRTRISFDQCHTVRLRPTIEKDETPPLRRILEKLRKSCIVAVDELEFIRLD